MNLLPERSPTARLLYNDFVFDIEVSIDIWPCRFTPKYTLNYAKLYLSLLSEHMLILDDLLKFIFYKKARVVQIMYCPLKLKN